MRKWINLVEGMTWDQQIDAGYETFYDLATSHWWDDGDEEKPDFSEKAFREMAEDFLEDLDRPLYRGMRISQHDLEQAVHLGVFYSMNAGHSQGFARGSDTYDARFNRWSEDARGVIIEIEPVHPDQVEAAPSVALNIYGGEEEVRLLENEPVTIRRIADEKMQPIWQHLWGKRYLT